ELRMFRELPVEPAVLFLHRRKLAAKPLRVAPLRGVPHARQRRPRGVVEPLPDVPVQGVERVADPCFVVACFVVACFVIAASPVLHWTPPQRASPPPHSVAGFR